MKKRYLCLAAICAAALLCGCSKTDALKSRPREDQTTSTTENTNMPSAAPYETEPSAETLVTQPATEPVATLPTEPVLEPTKPTLEPTAPASQEKPKEETPDPAVPVELPENGQVPYLVRVNDPSLPIHSGPGYRYNQVAFMGEAGIYTIVEEAWDTGNNLWGRLKSGIGWIPLTSREEGANVVYIRRPDQPIFSGPSYDYDYMGIISEAGSYTIVNACWDEEGNLWGELKSGSGWVDMTDISIDNSNPSPLSVGYADGNLLSSHNYHWAELSDSDYDCTIAFRAYEKLENVTIYTMCVGENGLVPGEDLFFLTEMTPDRPIVAELSFPGDMSAYGISFAGADGKVVAYVVTISGRNGMLVFYRDYP